MRNAVWTMNDKIFLKSKKRKTTKKKTKTEHPRQDKIVNIELAN